MNDHPQCGGAEVRVEYRNPIEKQCEACGAVAIVIDWRLSLEAPNLGVFPREVLRQEWWCRGCGRRSPFGRDRGVSPGELPESPLFVQVD